MLTVIPKSNSQEDKCPSWLNVVRSGDNKPLRPVIRCICGRYCDISNHFIHEDGRVTESFLCQFKEGPPGCGWHVWLKLEDWDGRRLPPGAQ